MISTIAPCLIRPSWPLASSLAARRWFAAGTAALLLGACGGGGGGGGASLPVAAVAPPAAEPAPSPSTLSGVVATGAPLAGASLTAVDSAGVIVCNTQVSLQGTYSCSLPATTKAPLVITARRDDQVLYSVAASTTGGHINVTPLTTIVVARLAPDGNPALLATALQTNASIAESAKVQAQVATLLVQLKPLLDALQDAIDPITGVFAANGSGHDRVLDSISVSVRPDGTASSIEITVRTLPAGGVDGPPVVIKFSSSDTTVPSLPATITAASLPPAGTSLEVTGLMDRSTACYALPLTQRVNAVNDLTAATGTAADVIGPACRSLFVGDNPVSYLNGGVGVGRDSANAGAFSGLFRPAATGMSFINGGFEYFRANGDYVLHYQTLDALGNVSAETAVARDVGGTLKFIGNQDAYSATVRPAVQSREFVNSSAFSYLSVGYDFSVSNVTDANGVPIFSKVVITAPDGSTYTLAPTVGNNNLRLLQPNGTVTGSSIVRLAAAYMDTTTPGNPATKDASLYFVSPQLTEQQIKDLPDQGLWSFEFFHANSATPNVVQTQRPFQRALSLREIPGNIVFPELTPAMRDLLVMVTSTPGYLVFATPPSAATPNIVNFNAGGLDAWAVPPGAVPPVTFTVFGYAPPIGNTTGAAFDDVANIPSSARSAQVLCSKATLADLHCDTSTAVQQYARNTSYNYLQLYGRNLKQLEIFKGIAVYKLVQ